MNRWTGYLSILLLALVTTAAAERGPLTAVLWCGAGLLLAALVAIVASAALTVGRRVR
jgi:hypothetical protein